MADHSCSRGCSHAYVDDSDPRAQPGVLQVQIDNRSIRAKKAEKTTLDVAGICCPSEVPLIRKLIEPLPGVHKVLVNVTGKTVTVHHDSALTSSSYLVKVLNDAKLEASIHNRGEWKATHKWPSPYTIVCGFIVSITFFQYVYSPLRWAGLGAVAVGSPPIIIRAFVSLRRCILDINVLLIIAVSGAIGLGDYLEAGSIVFLFTLADWLESRSSDKARMALASVANLAPQYAFLADDGRKVPVAEVIVGTRITVKAGDLVPIDGSVVSGKSTVDESSLTGEPLPVEKMTGATVWAGTLNLTGYLCIETTALAEDSAVARMIRLVEEAQTQRSHIEQLVEKFAKYYTPVILILAIVTATVPFALHVHNAQHWLYLALVLLVAACPCALVISTPVTTTCAIAQAARIGLVVKGGDSLEALGKLKMIAMDKTGTLTEGHFRVKEVCLLNRDVDLLELLYWIACIENKASHPMASSFVAYAKMHGIVPSGEVNDFEVLAGEGVTGVLDGHVIHIGNERLAKRLRWTESNPGVLETWKLEGWTITWVGVGEQLQAVLCAGDHLRSEAKEAVNALRKIGIQITMLTGDCQAAADIIQKKVGDINVHAQLLPEDKVTILKQLKTVGLTGMVGDGTNDAPALAAADVGIAMGVAGSAIAMEAADISLMTNDLRQLPKAVKLGRRAFRKIIQNIILSLLTKTLIIILAVLGYASLWAAVLADVGTCLLVIFNSMLLLERQKGKHESHGGNKASKRHHSHCAHGESHHDHQHSHCAHGESHHDHQHSHCEHKASGHNQHNPGGRKECKHDPQYDPEEQKHGCHHHEESIHDDDHSHDEHKQNNHEYWHGQEEWNHYPLCGPGNPKERKHGCHHHNHEENKQHHHHHYDRKESKHDQSHGDNQDGNHEDTKDVCQQSYSNHEDTKDVCQHSNSNHEDKHDDHHEHYEHKEDSHDHHHSNCEDREREHNQSHGANEDCRHNLQHSHGDHEATEDDYHRPCHGSHKGSNYEEWRLPVHEEGKHDGDYHSHCEYEESNEDDHRHVHGHHGHDHTHCDHGESMHDCLHSQCDSEESNHHHNHHGHRHDEECEHDDDDRQHGYKESKHARQSLCHHSHHHGGCDLKESEQELLHRCEVHGECKHYQHGKLEAGNHKGPTAKKYTDHHYRRCDQEEGEPDHHSHCDHRESKDDEDDKHCEDQHYHSEHKEGKHNDADSSIERKHVHAHHRHGCHGTFKHHHGHHEASKHGHQYHSHDNHGECRHDENLSHGEHKECDHQVSKCDKNHHHSYHGQESSKHDSSHCHDDHRQCGRAKSWFRPALCPWKPYLRESTDGQKGCKGETEGNDTACAVCCEFANRGTSNKKKAHNLCFHTPKRVASFTEEDVFIQNSSLRSPTTQGLCKDRDEYLCAMYCCEAVPHPEVTNR